MKIEIKIETIEAKTPIELPFSKAYNINNILLKAGFEVEILNEDDERCQRNKVFAYLPTEDDSEDELDTVGDFFVYTNANPYDVRELVRLLYEYKLFDHIDCNNVSIIKADSNRPI